ncbi:hypothetical protein [Salana multivorans]
MASFVITYHRLSGHVGVETFTDSSDAVDRQFELRDACTDPDVEIVTLTSESIETIRQTHSRYFMREDLATAV